MTLIGTKMVEDSRTAREIFAELIANPARNKFGFGEKLAIVNVDVQQAYTRTDLFKTAYETDPKQIDYINRISALARQKDMPVIWSQVAYKDDAADAGVWGTRTDTEDSLQNIKYGSERHQLDPRTDLLDCALGPRVQALQLFGSGCVRAAVAVADLAQSDR